MDDRCTLLSADREADQGQHACWLRPGRQMQMSSCALPFEIHVHLGRSCEPRHRGAGPSPRSHMLSHVSSNRKLTRLITAPNEQFLVEE